MTAFISGMVECSASSSSLLQNLWQQMLRARRTLHELQAEVDISPNTVENQAEILLIWKRILDHKDTVTKLQYVLDQYATARNSREAIDEF